jgi:hypothetical protein
MRKVTARKSVSELIKSSSINKTKKWLDTLGSEDKEYVTKVAIAASKSAFISIYSLARAVKEELGATVHHETIARTLKELMNGKA